MKFTLASVAVLATCGVLAGCSSGSEQEGVTVTLSAVAKGTAEPHLDDPAGAKQGGSEIKTFRRGDGMRIDLDAGLLSLVPVALQRCDGSSASLGDRLDALSPLAAAWAHGGGGETPAGAINVVKEDGTVFDLGSLLPAPGEYCGVQVERVPGVDETFGGYSVVVGPCYYPGTVGLGDVEADAVEDHSCVEVQAGTEVRSFTLPFTWPVTLDAANRELSLTVVVRYEEWFDGIDMVTLVSDPAQQQRLLDNIAETMHVLTDAEQDVAQHGVALLGVAQLGETQEGSVRDAHIPCIARGGGPGAVGLRCANPAHG